MSRTAIYPGTFDPVTNGHLDVISRGLRIFDRLVVAVARSDRKAPLFTVEERMAMLRQAVRGNRRITVDSFDGLLVRYARYKKVHVVIRGLRAVSDFEYEFQLALMNRKLDRTFETIYLMPSEQYTYLNSGLVKEIARHGGPVDALVPRPVARKLKEKFRAAD
jgi:pantetheine-phosphate adenylyltransferase